MQKEEIQEHLNMNKGTSISRKKSGSNVGLGKPGLKQKDSGKAQKGNGDT